MKFIKVTKLSDEFSIWVNAEQIVSLISKTNEPGCEIATSVGAVDVKETPAEIIAAINS